MLGIWLGSALSLQENRRRRIGKARQAEARIRSIVNQYGVPPGSARTLSMSLVQGTMLYVAELTWSGQRGVEGEYQRAINRMARSTLGGLQIHATRHPRGRERAHTGQSPLGLPVCTETLGQNPEWGGPEEVLEREGRAVVQRLRVASNTRCYTFHGAHIGTPRERRVIRLQPPDQASTPPGCQARQRCTARIAAPELHTRKSSYGQPDADKQQASHERSLEA